MIYYVEDDDNIRDLVVYTLNQSGFEALGVKNADEFYAASKKQSPALVLLDIMLPGDDGLSILKVLKTNKKTAVIPVIMVTARGTEYDKVIGLDSGADDYIAKPFGMMELVARVRALLRRTNLNSSPEILKEGGLVVDRQKHIVTVNNKNITLTLKEFELLYLLMANRGIVLTREQILESIWDFSYDGGTRTVDVHITTLRQKLGEYGNLIDTIRGVGYRFGGVIT
ncbi:MAG: response regulator transcription factor [Clostridiales bacterium]|jgi:two-component system alkaline phosphatase synthesis response regulator PhoP|uniref:Stage 0 sporulation protein A homolog n=1 Tax=Ruminiclostridium herbifermentans TaxID=2488810 RepID=A0A4U7JF36_9FIRM|nr:response regulator transcription factor [Ruminiclostridium herbifermentans]MCK9349912.1 response regulator transcription factor [Clostridiales bacterium]QNU68041.1 response regulator transcription factor [Ruminiclostridium herbifermentans]